MSNSDQGQTIDRLNFNGKEYMIADLTDKVKAGINVLLKIQQDLNNLSQEVRIQQAAQTEITKQITANIEEDKILISFIVYIFLLIFSRQTLIFSIIQIVLLVYIFTEYNKNDNFESLKKYIYLLIFIMLLGYEKYYSKQVSEKGEKFSIVKFIFGKREQEYDHEYIQFLKL